MAKTQTKKDETETVKEAIVQEPVQAGTPLEAKPVEKLNPPTPGPFTELVAFDPETMKAEARKAEDEYFIRSTAPLILHAIINRTSALPSPDGGADKAIEFAEALCKKLAARRV